MTGIDAYYEVNGEKFHIFLLAGNNAPIIHFAEPRAPEKSNNSAPKTAPKTDSDIFGAAFAKKQKKSSMKPNDEPDETLAPLVPKMDWITLQILV